MIDPLTERVRELTELVDPFGFDVKIDLGSDGVIHIASTEAPVVVSNEDKPASTTLKVSATTLQAILAGRQKVMSAYMFGKIRVQGDLDAARAAGVLPLGIVPPGEEFPGYPDLLIRAGAGRVLANLSDLEEVLPS